MRARNLKPGFFKNYELAEIQPLGRILFQGLWCLSDREGRLHDRSKQIKVEILPYDDCDIEGLLNELVLKKFITRYESNGYKYIEINNFQKHQHPHVKEVPSTIPAPDKNHTRTSRKRLIPPSPLLTPDSLDGTSVPTPVRPLTDIQKVVTVYKMVSGYPKDDPAWDKLNFARCSKSAKALLDFMGNWKDAGDCIQDVYEKLTAKGLTVTLETVAKHAAEWKKDKQEKGGTRGILPVPSNGSLQAI